MRKDPHRMKVRFTAQADADIIDCYLYGYVNFGRDQAERYERLSQGAEALRRLKPQEIRCLVLKAEGLTYQEICETTGWTYTNL